MESPEPVEKISGQSNIFLVSYSLYIIKDLLRNIKGAIYADDLVIWCSEEYLTTAWYRLQQALDRLSEWTQKCLVKINAAKTTFTIFSLSPTKKQDSIKFRIDGHLLKHDSNPTNLWITFDQIKTWKPQIDKVEKRAKAHLAFMRILSGVSWGADQKAQMIYGLCTNHNRLGHHLFHKFRIGQTDQWNWQSNNKAYSSYMPVTRYQKGRGVAGTRSKTQKL